MKINLFKLLHILFFIGISFGQAHTQGLPPRSTVKIGDGVYAASGFISNNMGFIVTDDGVAVIDTGTSLETGKEFLADIREITKKPIKYVVYTHYHYDHVAGAGSLKEKGTIFVAQENLVNNFNTLKKLERLNEEVLGSVKEASTIYPDLTYKENLTLNLGGKEIRLIHIKAETDDATLVYLPADKILFLGDLTNNNLGSPVMPEGYPEGLIEAIELIEKLEVDIFVPGHGFMEKTNKKSLQALKEVTKYLMREIKKCVDEGLDLEETQAAIKMPDDFKDNILFSKTFLTCKEQYVNRLHKDYTGYFGKDPIKFAPAPKQERNALIAEIAGGEQKLLEVAERLTKQGKYQLALEILDIVTTNVPLNRDAHSLKEKAFLGHASITRHNWHRMVAYVNAAKKERRLAQKK